MNHPTAFRLLASTFAAALLTAAHAAEPLTVLPSCKFSPTDWADGDSFQIQTADGKVQTIRLYGADCVEWHVSDESDARRLRSQRRYFGISEAAPQAQEAINLAKGFGKSAAEETARVLAKPFTVHTAFADARGDAKYKRIYAFVTTADGVDLAEHLVRKGLARAFGVYRETPSGKSGREFQELLSDAELVAAKAGAGIWAKTKWDRLPSERQQQRDEDAELEMAAGNAKPAPADGLKLNPNTAARDELMKLPGVGEVTANRIIEGRPYRNPADLAKLQGFSPAKLGKLLPHLEIPAAP